MFVVARFASQRCQWGPQGAFDATSSGPIEALGRLSLAIVTDVTVAEQVNNMAKQTVDRFVPIEFGAVEYGSDS